METIYHPTKSANRSTFEAISQACHNIFFSFLYKDEEVNATRLVVQRGSMHGNVQNYTAQFDALCDDSAGMVVGTAIDGELRYAHMAWRVAGNKACCDAVKRRFSEPGVELFHFHLDLETGRLENLSGPSTSSSKIIPIDIAVA